MKRMAVIAVAIALSALPACAQRGGAHGGISGSHAGGGFSSPRGGFSGGHGGFSAPRAPSFHAGPGTPVRSGPLRFAGSSPGGFHPQPPPIRVPSRLGGPIQGPSLRPRQSVSSRIPYPGHGVPRVGPITSGPHRFDGGTQHRMPYHSPYSGNRYNSGDRNHGGDWNHHGDRWHDHDWDHHHHGFYGVYGWVGSPYWPWWGWGYPYLPAYWDSWNDYDNQPGANYGAALYPEYSPAPYEEPAPDQPDSTPWPYSSPAPPASQPSPAVPAAPEAPVTLVFKDRRPNQQIRNYLLTAKTLSVLDQQRRDIPVDQIDLAATARLNREAGVEFEVPSGGR